MVDIRGAGQLKNSTLLTRNSNHHQHESSLFAKQNLTSAPIAANTASTMRSLTNHNQTEPIVWVDFFAPLASAGMHHGS
jgi:hypothetical protein